MSTEPDENGNINCTNCTYCIDCIDCTDCTSCINCINCTDIQQSNYCNTCINCTYMFQSSNCNDCTSCSFCISCTSCIDNCISCNDCINCTYIFNCNYLDHCSNCGYCDYCVNCTNCKKCTNLIYLNSVDRINNYIGNIYNVNENYINTDTININPVFSFTSGNVLFTNITPNTLSINETTGNISGVISALPTVTLTYRNQEYSYTFNTNVVRVYNVNLCNNYVVYS